MPDYMPTIETLIGCVEREVSIRRRVYPRWVASGKMKPAKAEEEIRQMEAVLGTLRWVQRQTQD